MFYLMDLFNINFLTNIFIYYFMVNRVNSGNLKLSNLAHEDIATHFYNMLAAPILFAGKRPVDHGHLGRCHG